VSTVGVHGVRGAVPGADARPNRCLLEMVLTAAHWTLDRAQTVGEEIANGVSHGVPRRELALGPGREPILIVAAVGCGAAMVAAVSIFGATRGCSTLPAPYTTCFHLAAGSVCFGYWITARSTC